MKKKIFILFLIIIFFIPFSFLLKQENKKIIFSNPVFYQYIPFEKKLKPLSISFLSTNNKSKRNLMHKETNTPITQKHSDFILFSSCSSTLNKPDSLAKKLKKDIPKSHNDTSPILQNIGCGLIKTIIPLPF